MVCILVVFCGVWTILERPECDVSKVGVFGVDGTQCNLGNFLIYWREAAELFPSHFLSAEAETNLLAVAETEVISSLLGGTAG